MGVITIKTDFFAFLPPSAVSPRLFCFNSSGLDFFCTPLITLVLFHYSIPLVPSNIVDWFPLLPSATLCRLQSALRGSTGTAAASRVRNVCTAPGRAIMSRATVSACLASPAPCATKASSLLCPFALFSTVSLTVKFIHCEVLAIATGK